MSVTLLRGVVGSTAYGLAHEGSDVDRLAMHVEPVEAILSLDPPKETVTHSGPDYAEDFTSHEAKKFVQLCLKCNPTALELLWLPEYEVSEYLGRELCHIRKQLVSRKLVRNAYLGYITQQFRRLETRGDGSFSADTRKRTAKHARHMWRLSHQGMYLWTQGELVIRLNENEVDQCRAFSDRVVTGDMDAGRDLIDYTELVFDGHTSPIPLVPNERLANDWLLAVRRAY